MSAIGGVFFYLLAAAALLSAIATAMMKNSLRSAVALLFHIATLAALYLTLHAHLLAALQLIVYAGAVVVLFIFVIMLIGPVPSSQSSVRGLLVRTVGICFLAMSGMALVSVVLPYAPTAPLIQGCPPGHEVAECGQFGGVESVAQSLFGRYVVPFELASVVLLVAILGAIAVAKGRMTAPTAKEAAPGALRAPLDPGLGSLSKGPL